MDFTDRNTEKVAPVLYALGAVQSAARAAITAVESIVTPPSPGQAPVRKHPAQKAAAFAAEETLQHLDPTLIRNATVLRSIGPAAAANIPALTRIALDISAEIAPGAPVAINAPVIGKFGLPRPAPAQTESGPALKHGYADATANLPPVLPAVHMRG